MTIEDDKRTFKRRFTDTITMEMDESFSNCPKYLHHDLLIDRLNAIAKEVHELNEAFPNRDTEAHREYHDALISNCKAQERFWTDLKQDLAKSGAKGLIFVLLGFLFTGAIVALKAKLGQ